MNYDSYKHASEPERDSPPTLHCWEGNDASTCMLEAGHDGPHEWTPDSEIGVTFVTDEPCWSPYPEPPEGNANV